MKRLELYNSIAPNVILAISLECRNLRRLTLIHVQQKDFQGTNVWRSIGKTLDTIKICSYEEEPTFNTNMYSHLQRSYGEQLQRTKQGDMGTAELENIMKDCPNAAIDFQEEGLSPLKNQETIGKRLQNATVDRCIFRIYGGMGLLTQFRTHFHYISFGTFGSSSCFQNTDTVSKGFKGFLRRLEWNRCCRQKWDLDA